MPTSPASPRATEPEDEQVEDGRARVEVAERLRRGRLVTAAVVGVLVVVVGVTALLGGFRSRSDLQTPVAVGSVIATGPYEVTFDSATYRHITGDDHWEVVASGTARTAGDTSIQPGTGDSGFVAARAEATGETQSSDSVQIGAADATEHLDNLTPGLPPVPWSVRFEFTREPGNQLFLGVFGQQYTTPYLFSTEMGWRATKNVSTMTLPMTRLPDQEY